MTCRQTNKSSLKRQLRHRRQSHAFIDIDTFNIKPCDSQFALFCWPKTKMSATGIYGGKRTGVRVVVAGDRGTGKSTLISAVATEAFDRNVPPVLPPTRLPADLYNDLVPLTVIDTSSRYVYTYTHTHIHTH